MFNPVNNLYIRDQRRGRGGEGQVQSSFGQKSASATSSPHLSLLHHLYMHNLTLPQLFHHPPYSATPPSPSLFLSIICIMYIAGMFGCSCTCQVLQVIRVHVYTTLFRQQVWLAQSDAQRVACNHLMYFTYLVIYWFTCTIINLHQ